MNAQEIDAEKINIYFVIAVNQENASDTLKSNICPNGALLRLFRVDEDLGF